MFGNSRFFSSILLASGIFLAGFSVSQAALKDSDVDGLTDEAEVGMYRTDPKNHDTDGDGFDDGYEITQNTNPIDTKDIPFEASMDPEAGAKQAFWMRVFLGIAGIGIVMSLGYIFVRREELSR